MDLATAPEHFVGRVTWHRKPLPSKLHRQLVPHPWPSEALPVVGVPPVNVHSATERVKWTTDESVCTYEPSTLSWVPELTGHTSPP